MEGKEAAEVPLTRPYPIERRFVGDDVVSRALLPVEALADELVAIEHAASDPPAGLVALVKRLGERGLLELVAPTRGDPSSRALCLARERLAYFSPLADLAFTMQGLGSLAIARAGGEEARKWLPRITTGEAVAAFALTEPDAGSDLGSLRTRAREDGGSYLLNGHKTLISNAGIASLYTVFAVTDDASPKRRLSAFLVPANARGVEVRPLRVLGGHPIGEVILKDVQVPASHRLGAEGDGMSLALATLTRFRPTVGAAALGMAQRALDEAVHHVKHRVQFEKSLAEQPVVQSMIADMACDVEAARLLVYRAAFTADDPDATRQEIAHQASVAKLVATEAAQRVVDTAVQLHGGRGVLADGIVARLYEDVRSLRIYEGATEIQRLLVARELLG